MDNKSAQQICIACNKRQSSIISNCDCGHVMRESLTLETERSRKRRAPYRPNSVSSEWIGHDQANKSIFRKPRRISPNNLDMNNNGDPLPLQQTTKQNTKQKRGRNFSLKERKRFPVTADEEKKAKLKEILHLIENSYQNVYFNRCKSYRKAKLTDLDFEFDFSTFDSHTPFYPTALEDINSKIIRTSTFHKLIEHSISQINFQ